MIPLDDVAAGRQSNEIISWSDDLRAAFKEAQLALSSNRTITLPKPDDLLWIVTDGAVRTPGIGARYVTRGDKLHLAGFFSAKLRGSPGCLVRWRHSLSQLPPNTSVLTSSSPTTTHAFSQTASPVSKHLRSCAAASFPPVHVFLPSSQS